MGLEEEWNWREELALRSQGRGRSLGLGVIPAQKLCSEVWQKLHGILLIFPQLFSKRTQQVSIFYL